MKLNPETLAKASSRHPWRTVIVWVVLLVMGIASAATLLGPALTTDFDFTNSPEAKRAQLLLEERNLTEDVISETFVLAAEPGAIEDPAFAEQVNAFMTELRELGPDVFSALPASFPTDRGGGRRSTGGGPRPDPVRGRVRRVVHGHLRR